MRLPAQEDDPLLLAVGADDLGQHAGFARLDHLEALQAEGVLRDHVLDQAVAVVARLDAVDLALELLAVFGDVAEALDAAVGRQLVDRQRVFRPDQIPRNGLDRPVLAVLLDVAFHGRHPVAEEDVDFAGAEALVGDRDRQHLRARIVAQRLEHHRGRRGGRRDVRPPDVGEADILAGCRIGRPGGGRKQHGGNGAQSRQSHPSCHGNFLRLRSPIRAP